MGKLPFPVKVVLWTIGDVFSILVANLIPVTSHLGSSLSSQEVQEHGDFCSWMTFKFHRCRSLASVDCFCDTCYSCAHALSCLCCTSCGLLGFCAPELMLCLPIKIENIIGTSDELDDLAILHFWFCFSFETRAYYLDQTGLELLIFLFLSHHVLGL